MGVMRIFFSKRIPTDRGTFVSLKQAGNASNGVAMAGLSNHHFLAGLTEGDDHTQYMTAARTQTFWDGQTSDDLTEGSTNFYAIDATLDARTHMTVAGVDGGYLSLASTSETVTLATDAATTETTVTIPENSILIGTTARVTASITTAATWSIYVTGAAEKTILDSTSVTADDTVCAFTDTGMFGDDVILTESTITIACDVTPDAGEVKVTMYYLQLVAPTI